MRASASLWPVIALQVSSSTCVVRCCLVCERVLLQALSMISGRFRDVLRGKLQTACWQPSIGLGVRSALSYAVPEQRTSSALVEAKLGHYGCCR